MLPIRNRSPPSHPIQAVAAAAAATVREERELVYKAEESYGTRGSKRYCRKLLCPSQALSSVCVSPRRRQRLELTFSTLMQSRL